MRFNNIYETMELAGGDNILRREKLTKNGNQASKKEKQAQIDQMKAMFSLISTDQKIYIFLLG